jgi:BspA type Leucine rich repeat region (6 copies)
MTTKHSLSVPFPPACGTAGFKKTISSQCPGWKLAAILCCLANPLMAAELGDFTYVDNGNTVTITDYPTSATGAVVIPQTILDPVTLLEDTVTGIGFEAFRDCTQITSVSIPSGVTSIGNNAFYNCVGLATVSISPAVTGLNIGTYAFYNCLSLNSISLPFGVASIGANAFYFCKGMASVSIPTSVTSIGIGAFYSCTSLTSLVLPSSISSIPSGAFYSCSGLTAVSIPSSVTSIGIEAFRYCSALTSVTLPPNLLALQNRAFANCRGLKTITIPATVNSIGTDVFSICSALESISVAEANTSYSSSPDGVLFNEAQTNLIAFPPGKGGGYSIPATVMTIGNKAFFTCEKLVGVTFPPGLLSIGTQAFSTCGSLRYANFTGDEPFISSNVFELAGPGFAVYYLSTIENFTISVESGAPTWSVFEYPAFEMGADNTPLSGWLLSKGVPANSAASSDTDGDGVSLLMAYALNLDPLENLSSKVPQPVFGTNQMSLNFYSGNNAITYRVRTSTDLVDWTEDGVTLSAPDVNQIKTATVATSGPGRYMRLEVSY